MMHSGHRDLGSLDTLDRVVSDLAGEFRLEPLLDLILRNSVRLLGCSSGSLCLVDARSHTYRKHIDVDVGCQAGRVFCLDEGVTGAVARSGGPVAFRHYADVPGGHVAPSSELYRRAVLGVPIGSKPDLVGSLVVFSRDEERVFVDADAFLLQRFATHAAIAMANARVHAQTAQRAMDAMVWAERGRALLEFHDTLDTGLADLVLRLEEAEQYARHGGSVTGMLRSAVEAAEELLAGGRRALRDPPETAVGRPHLAAHLTVREREVLVLLRQGLADKQLATRLGISVKTVEKHVGAVLRKHGVRSRVELLATTPPS